MRTSIETNHTSREAVGHLLNLLLADEYMLYKITRDYHWNVTGPDFFSLRLQFQLQHDTATTWVDDVAERIRQMRLDSRISWTELKDSARCSAAAGLGLSAERMLAELLRTHGEIIAQLRCDSAACRHDIDDPATADFLTSLLEQHENSAWMLRAQLEQPDGLRFHAASPEAHV